MFVDFADPQPSPRRGSWTDLPDDEALLLWSLRRLVVAWPGSCAVEAALHQRYGSEATAVLALLRCWLGGLASRAGRQLHVGDPACALLLADESAMLLCWRHAGEPARALLALRSLCRRDAATLLPLAAALGGFIAAS